MTNFFEKLLIFIYECYILNKYVSYHEISIINLSNMAVGTIHLWNKSLKQFQNLTQQERRTVTFEYCLHLLRYCIWGSANSVFSQEEDICFVKKRLSGNNIIVGYKGGDLERGLELLQ